MPASSGQGKSALWRGVVLLLQAVLQEDYYSWGGEDLSVGEGVCSEQVRAEDVPSMQVSEVLGHRDED